MVAPKNPGKPAIGSKAAKAEARAKLAGPPTGEQDKLKSAEETTKQA